MVRIAPKPLVLGATSVDAPPKWTEEYKRSVHVPGMYFELTLPAHPAPKSLLCESLVVPARRDESKFFVDPDYVVASVGQPGPCEADAVFRVFEGVEATPPRPLTASQRADLARRRLPIVESFDCGASYDERSIGEGDVRRVCREFCEADVAESEALHFMRRFGMQLGEEKDPLADGAGGGSSAGAGNTTAPHSQDRGSAGGGGGGEGGAPDRAVAGGLAQKAGSSPRRLTLAAFKAQLGREASARVLNPFDVLFLYFEDPTSSRCSLYLASVVMLLILVSSFGGVFETLPAFLSKPRDQPCTPEKGCVDFSSCGRCEPELNSGNFRVLEIVCTLVFTGEYLVRLLTVGFTNYGAMQDTIKVQVICPKGHQEHAARIAKEEASTSARPPLRKVADFVLDPMNVIDVVAVLPFFLEVLFGSQVTGLNVVRLMRIARVFRMFKRLDKYRHWVVLLTESLAGSMQGLQILSFVFFLGLILFGSLLFFAEEGAYQPEDGGGEFLRVDVTGYVRDVSPFSSIPRSIWYVIVTGPTTGFGDMFPTTKAGKLVGTFLVCSTMLVLAFPVTIIAKNLDDKLREMSQAQGALEPYDLAWMAARQATVESLSRQITELCTASRDAKKLDPDDACWIATQCQEMAARYRANRQSTAHWDSCVQSIMAILARQPEFGTDKRKLRQLVYKFLHACIL